MYFENLDIGDGFLPDYLCKKLGTYVNIRKNKRYFIKIAPKLVSVDGVAVFANAELNGTGIFVFVEEKEAVVEILKF